MIRERLSPAPRARHLRSLDPGADAPGFTLSPAPRAGRFNYIVALYAL